MANREKKHCRATFCFIMTSAREREIDEIGSVYDGGKIYRHVQVRRLKTTAMSTFFLLARATWFEVSHIKEMDLIDNLFTYRCNNLRSDRVKSSLKWVRYHTVGNDLRCKRPEIVLLNEVFRMWSHYKRKEKIFRCGTSTIKLIVRTFINRRLAV